MVDKTLERLEKELPLRRRQQARVRARLIAVRRRLTKVKDAITRRRVSDRERAVRWALKQAGTVEHPAGSNSGPRISGWIKASGGVVGQPWCQNFANAVAVHGGCPQIHSSFTPTVLSGAFASLGYRKIPLSEAQRGDMIFFKFPGVSDNACDHVGIKLDSTRTVEGNTSPGSAGSQNNGGGVFVRDDHMQFAVGAVRVPYES